LPAAVQEQFVRTIPGCERAVLVRPGYAVEYDAVDARQLDHRLASKTIGGLFFAGQINGTSGYEEAAAQGLLAGANAALAVLGRGPLVIARDRGYVGVLVDDLVTQGCDEPYRMFTSRAEYRLELREDNADERLAAIAHAAGLIDASTWSRVAARLERVERLVAAGGDDGAAWLVEKARARAVYAGYLARQRREAARIRGDDAIDLPIPDDVDWCEIGGLSREMSDRLRAVRPTTTAQASRIPGMTPAALSIVWAHARRVQRQLRERSSAVARGE
jgi:tRNA uridine 5-carboxymethylaminomethyl modification enzyme